MAHKKTQEYVISFKENDTAINRNIHKVHSKEGIEDVFSKVKSFIKLSYPHAVGFCITNMTQSE